MFYNTGSSYDPTTSPPQPDGGDGNNSPPPRDRRDLNPPVVFGSIAIDVGAQANIDLVPPASGTYKDILFFQRRLNTSPLTIAGSAGGTLNLHDARIYAKWAPLSITRTGTYRAQFIAGSMSVTAPGAEEVKIDPGDPSRKLGAAHFVFLVQ